MLEWQTAKLLELETRRAAHVVYVRPAAGRGGRVQRHPGEPHFGWPGAALRARRAYRPDNPDQSDTIETVRQLHRPKSATRSARADYSRASGATTQCHIVEPAQNSIVDSDMSPADLTAKLEQLHAAALSWL